MVRTRVFPVPAEAATQTVSCGLAASRWLIVALRIAGEGSAPSTSSLHSGALCSDIVMPPFPLILPGEVDVVALAHHARQETALRILIFFEQFA